MRGHSDSVDQLAWHPQSPFDLVSASADKSVIFWDLRAPTKPPAGGTAAPRSNTSGFVSHSGPAAAMSAVQTKGENINLAWSPDGNTVAVGNKDDLISFVDVRKRKVMRELQFPSEVNEMTWSPGDGKCFLVTNDEGRIEIYGFPSMQLLRSIAAHTAHVYCIEFDPTGK